MPFSPRSRRQVVSEKLRRLQPVFDAKIGNAPEVSLVVGDHAEIMNQSCSGDKDIRVTDQFAVTTQPGVNIRRSDHDLLSYGQDRVLGTERVESFELLCGLFGFQAAQDFVTGDMREREPVVLVQINARPGQRGRILAQ